MEITQTLTFELHPDDRQRLDLLAAGLVELTKQQYALQARLLALTEQLQTAGTPYSAPTAEPAAPAEPEAPQEPAQPAKRARKAKQAPAPTPEEKPAENAAQEPTEAPAPEPAPEPAQPQHTADDLRGRIVQLLAEKPTLSAPMQRLVQEYAPKVTAVPASKIDELLARIEELAAHE